jgi:DNA-binding MarR family transcriptional regulator
VNTRNHARPDAVEAVRALARVSRLLERASGDLSLAHYRILTAVAAGDERASGVAARLALGKPTVSASVDALCKRGLLVRAGVAGDHRATALSLTRSGQAVLAAAEAAMLDRLAAVLGQVARPDVVITALTELGAGLDQLAAARRPAGAAGTAGTAR